MKKKGLMQLFFCARIFLYCFKKKKKIEKESIMGIDISFVYFYYAFFYIERDVRFDNKYGHFYRIDMTEKGLTHKCTYTQYKMSMSCFCQNILLH